MTVVIPTRSASHADDRCLRRPGHLRRPPIARARPRRGRDALGGRAGSPVVPRQHRGLHPRSAGRRHLERLRRLEPCSCPGPDLECGARPRQAARRRARAHRHRGRGRRRPDARRPDLGAAHRAALGEQLGRAPPRAEDLRRGTSWRVRLHGHGSTAQPASKSDRISTSRQMWTNQAATSTAGARLRSSSSIATAPADRAPRRSSGPSLRGSGRTTRVPSQHLAERRRLSRGGRGGRSVGRVLVEREAAEEREDRGRAGRVVVSVGIGRPSAGSAPGAGSGAGPAAIERHSALCTPGRYGLVRRLASTPAMPWAVTAAWSARPSPAIAGTTTTSSPGRSTRRRVCAALLERRGSAASARRGGGCRTRGRRPAGPACR